MINYKFNITKYNLKIIEQDTAWVIRDISWIYSGVDSSGIYASCEGTTSLNYSPDQENFKPVADVTANDLTIWLLDAMGGPYLRHLRDSIEGTMVRNAEVLTQELPMDTWIPLAGPGTIEVSN